MIYGNSVGNVTLIGCITSQSPFLVVTRMYMSKQLDFGTLFLNGFLLPMI